MKRYRGILLLAGVVAVHEALLASLDRADVVGRALAAGTHTPAWVLASVALFLAVRLFVFLAVPGWLAFALVAAVLAERSRRRDATALATRGPADPDREGADERADQRGDSPPT